MNRPKHLIDRPVVGWAFGESAVVIRRGEGDRNEDGVWARAAATRTGITVASAPILAEQASVIVPDGVRLDSVRQFWAPADSVRPIKVGSNPSDADLIEHDGTIYRVTSVQNWGGFQEIVGQYLRAAPSDGDSDDDDDDSPGFWALSVGEDFWSLSAGEDFWSMDEAS